MLAYSVFEIRGTFATRTTLVNCRLLDDARTWDIFRAPIDLRQLLRLGLEMTHRWGWYVILFVFLKYGGFSKSTALTTQSKWWFVRISWSIYRVPAYKLLSPCIRFNLPHSSYSFQQSLTMYIPSLMRCDVFMIFDNLEIILMGASSSLLFFNARIPCNKFWFSGILELSTWFPPSPI